MHSSFESHNLIGPDEVLISRRVSGTLRSKPCFQAERGGAGWERLRTRKGWSR